jgi:hypothetical protein
MTQTELPPENPGRFNAPGETVWGTPQLDSIGLGVGQAPAAFGTGKFLIAVEGMIV